MAKAKKETAAEGEALGSAGEDKELIQGGEVSGRFLGLFAQGSPKEYQLLEITVEGGRVVSARATQPDNRIIAADKGRRELLAQDQEGSYAF